MPRDDRSARILECANQMVGVGGWEYVVADNLFVPCDNWKRMHGVSFEQSSLEALLPIAHTDDLSTIEHAFEQALHAGKDYSIKHRIIKQDTGEVRWIRAYGTCVLSAEGKTERIVGAALDVTSEKTVEDELRRSEQLFKNLYRHTPAMMHSIDADGVIVAVSDKWLEESGYRREEVIGQKSVDFLTPESKKRAVEVVLPRYFETGRLDDAPFEFVKKNGDVIDVLLSARAEFDSRGNFLRSLAVTRDVTDLKRARRQLLQREQRHSQIIDFLPDATLAVDRDGKIVAWNRAMEELTGCRAEQMIGRDHFEHALPFYGSRRPMLVDLAMNPDLNIDEQYDQLSFAAQSVTAEIRIDNFGEEGAVLWGVSAPLFDLNGEVDGAIESIRDVTQRRRVEEIVAESESRYRMLFQSMVAGFALHEIILDDRGNPCDYLFLEVNPAFEKLTGFAAAEITGKRLLEVLPETEPFYIQQYGQVALTGKSLYFESYSRGLGRYFEVSAYSPKPGQFATVFNDVTERRRANEALRESEEKYRLAMESTNVALFDWDMTANIVKFSHAWKKIFETDRLTYGFQELIDLGPPEGREYVAAMADEHISGRSPRFEVEVPYVTEKGNKRWMLARGEIVERDETGAPSRLMGTVIDTTFRKQAEEQLRHAHKMEAVGQLAGGIAHDFNNMLQAIVGFTDLALEECTAQAGDLREGCSPRDGSKITSSDSSLPVGEGRARGEQDAEGILESSPSADRASGAPGRVAAHLSEVRMAAERATALTKQLLTFSRRDSYQPRPVNLNEVIEGFSKLLLRVLGEKAELEYDFADHLPSVLGDARQLEQVILNLCVNARDAMPEGGVVSIETEYVERDGVGQLEKVGQFEGADRLDVGPGKYVVLKIRDTGVGISPELRPRIFEPFFTTKKVGEGTGLGLATTYAIVKRHQGTIEVESAVGSGTTFRVYFPASDEIAIRQNAQQDAPPVHGRGKTILVAEDDQAVRNLTATVLRRSGYRLLLAEDAEQAMKWIDEQGGDISVALLDVVMPKAGGGAVLQYLRECGIDIPVVFCTGYSRTGGGEEQLPSDVPVLFKPYGPVELLAAIRQAVEGVGSSTPKP